MSESEFYSYCLVRTDLSASDQAVQAGHAWWEVARSASPGDSRYLQCNFVLIGVANEEELIVEASVLLAKGVKLSLFFERDHDRGYTAAASPPLAGEQRQPFQHYSLLGYQELEDAV